MAALMFMDFLSDTEVVNLIEEDVQTRPVSQAERIANCSKTFAGFFNPQNGKYRTVPYRCMVWRECANCLADRVVAERAKIDLALDQDEVWTLELPEQEMNEFCSGMGKKDYRRYPGETLDRVFFILGEDVGDSTPYNPTEVTVDLMHELDWSAIILTPKGRKLSGSLGYCAPSGSESVKIKVECVMSDASEELVEQAVQWAIDETKDLRPTTLEEVIVACQKRTYEHKSCLVANGARLFPSRTQTVSVDVGRLSEWGGPGYHDQV
jgi:hypothetical protein